MPDDIQAGLPAGSGRPRKLPADVNVRKPGDSTRRVIRIALVATLAINAAIASWFFQRWQALTTASAAADDSEVSLDGTWVSTAVTIDGIDDVGQAQLQMTASGRFRLDLPDKTKTGAYIARGKSIDLADDETLLRFFAIYKQDGDTLTICFADAAYPTDFTAGKGSGRTLMVMKRQWGK